MSAIIIIACILFAGFFAGIETGILTADQLLILSKKEKRVFHARVAHFLLIRPERLLSTTLIGTNIAVVTAAVTLEFSLAEAGFPEWSAWLSGFGLTIIILICSEIIPKSFLRKYADTVSVRLAPVLAVFYVILLPVSSIFNLFVKLLLLVLRQKDTRRLPRSREDLRLLMRVVGKESGIKMTGQKIIDNILDFKETTAQEVMIPFNTVPMLPIDAPVSEAIALYDTTGARFILLHTGNAEDIAGYIDVEVLASRKIGKLAEIMKKTIYYPETKKIPFLLLSMNYKDLDAVLISDEYGRISGMITANLIASEIVGYIPGEKPFTEREFEPISDSVFHVAGTYRLDDLHNETGISITKGTYDTIGGYMCDMIGEIPQIGRKLKGKGFECTVLDRDEKHVKRVEIRKTSTADRDGILLL